MCVCETNVCMRLVTKIYETQSNQIAIMVAVQSINDFFPAPRLLFVNESLYVPVSAYAFGVFGYLQNVYVFHQR